MKHFNWLFIGFLALVSCENNQRELNELKKQVDSLTRAVSEKDSMIAQLNGTIVKLQYPADQRIAKAKSLVDEEKFEQALGEIRSLKELFPNSTEANSSSILIETINKKREEKGLQPIAQPTKENVDRARQIANRRKPEPQGPVIKPHKPVKPQPVKIETEKAA